MASLEFRGPSADEIKRHPEVETLLVTRANRTQAMKKVLNWLVEAVSWGPCSLPRNTPSFRLRDA